MSIFRNFSKTLSSTKFTKPNNILLTHKCPTVYLCTSNEPSIEHLNSVKALFQTIKKLEVHSSNSGYKTIVEKELGELRHSSKRYTQSCVRYIETGGRLTAQGLANVYACAEQLGVNTQWLQIYAQPEIPHLIRYMSVQNLKDVQQGLKKYNGSTNFSTLVENQLKTRNQQPYEYVERAVNEANVYQQSTTGHSNNHLLNAIQSKQNILWFHLNRLWRFEYEFLNSYFSKAKTGYPLH